MTARSSWPPGSNGGPGDGSKSVEIRIALRAVAIGALVFGLVPVGRAGKPAENDPDHPAFVSSMRTENPDDQTILHYWERAQTGQLSAEELVDLGTMLFRRGFPDDARWDRDKTKVTYWNKVPRNWTVSVGGYAANLERAGSAAPSERLRPCCFKAASGSSCAASDRR